MDTRWSLREKGFVGCKNGFGKGSGKNLHCLHFSTSSMPDDLLCVLEKPKGKEDKLKEAWRRLLACWHYRPLRVFPSKTKSSSHCQPFISLPHFSTHTCVFLLLDRVRRHPQVGEFLRPGGRVLLDRVHHRLLPLPLLRPGRRAVARHRHHGEATPPSPSLLIKLLSWLTMTIVPV